MPGVALHIVLADRALARWREGAATAPFDIDDPAALAAWRHGAVGPDIGYEALRTIFESRLPADVHLFKEYHGLIVWTGKDYCRRSPKCEGCPLAPLLKRGQPILG